MRKTGNLKMFKPGQSGNLQGRPKKLPAIDQLLAEVLAEPTETGIDTARAIVMALVKKALKGDHRAAEIILDRAYGKARQGLDINADIKHEYEITLNL